MISAALSFRPSEEIFKGAGNIRPSQDFSLTLEMTTSFDFSESRRLAYLQNHQFSTMIIYRTYNIP